LTAILILSVLRIEQKGDTRQAQNFLASLCTINLVEKSQSLYQNKIDTDAYLVKKKSEYIGSMLAIL
jgi:hypothetical protein